MIVQGFLIKFFVLLTVRGVNSYLSHRWPLQQVCIQKHTFPPRRHGL